MIDALAVLSNEAHEGIDARELHTRLKVGRDFSTWIKERIDSLGLEAGRDYETAQGLRSPNPGSSKSREQISIEYSLSIGSAKLIALSTRGPESRAALEHLVKIEEAWNSPTALMARAVTFANAELARLKHELSLAIPKLQALGRIASADGDVGLQECGRLLGLPPNKHVEQMIKDGLLFRGPHGKPTPYALLIERGYFRVVLTEPDESGQTFAQTKVTPLGMTWLAGRYGAAKAIAPRGQA